MHQDRIIAGAAVALAITLTGPACGSIGGDGNPPGGADGGSGDGGPATDSTCETRGGTRLRQVMRAAADGSEEHLHFQDTELDTPCGFAPAADGSVRCLPRPGGRFRIADAIYSDDQCDSAIAQIDREQPAGDLMELRRAGACFGLASAYHRVGPSAGITSGQQTWVLVPDQGCVPHQAGDLTAYDYREIGAEIPPGDFVEASETMIGDGRLRVPRFDGADGSSECRAGRPLRDQELDGAACEPALAEDGLRRCLPLGESPVEGGIFSDAECSAPVQAGLLDGTCAPDATVIREYVDAACGTVQRVRAMGAALGQLYSTAPGECSPTPERQQFFRVGPAMAPGSFAELSASEIPAGDRLLQLVLTGEGVRIPSGLWRDPSTGADCRFEPATDGETRCLPTPTLEAPQGLLSTVSTITYSDPDCTMPLMVATLSQTAACGGAAPTYVVNPVGHVEGVPEGAVYQLGALIDDPIYRKAGTCALYSPGVELYRVEAAVPAESFVAAFD